MHEELVGHYQKFREGKQYPQKLWVPPLAIIFSGIPDKITQSLIRNCTETFRFPMLGQESEKHVIKDNSGNPQILTESINTILNLAKKLYNQEVYQSQKKVYFLSILWK